MSTNRTENYQLHVWGAEDEESLAELNENFAKLDQGAAWVVMGTYDGDGTADRVIELGFTPRAVLLENSGGQRLCNLSGPRGGLVFPDYPSSSAVVPLKVVEGGFQVGPDPNQNGHRGTNGHNVNYRYIAFR